MHAIKMYHTYEIEAYRNVTKKKKKETKKDKEDM